MRQAEVINTLMSKEAAIRNLGVGALYLYGSHARDEARPDSDVDLFFDKDPDRPLGFLELTGLKIMLEDAFGRQVDVGTRTGLHPVLRSEIEASAIRVF